MGFWNTKLSEDNSKHNFILTGIGKYIMIWVVEFPDSLKML